MSTKKGISVWIFGFLTFLAVLHTLDGFLSFVSGGASSLLKLYPINFVLRDVDAVTYFWSSLLSAFVLFGLTCIIACHNPIMTLYHKVLAEVEFAESEVDEAVKSEYSLLEMINSSLTSNSVVLQRVKRQLSYIKDAQENLKTKMSCLRVKLTELEAGLSVGFKKLEKDSTETERCPSCGTKVSPRFRICPNRGAKLWHGVVQMQPVSLRQPPTDIR